MTDKAISPLRRRMSEDMTIRKLTPKTQHDYKESRTSLCFLGDEDVRRDQLHLLAALSVGRPSGSKSNGLIKIRSLINQ